MDIFDVLGPVMIGPSSSHTAGLVRIGNVAHEMLGDTPDYAHIQFHGSLAKTYRGHGSDKAIVAGLMGFETDDARIRDSLKLAKEGGMKYDIETVVLENAHPNTVVVHGGKAGEEAITLRASSIGGGNIEIEEINGATITNG